MARSPQITEIGDPRLVKALAHPLRVQILQALSERDASPSELARELDVPLPNLSYHFRMLVQLDMLTLKRTAQRRGAIEHYYRAKPGVGITESAWRKLPTLVTNKVVGHVLQQLGADAVAAAESNGFKSGRVTRKSVELDVAGWEAVDHALAEADKAIDDAIRASMKRTDGNGVPGTVAMLVFADPQDRLAPTRVMDAVRELRERDERVTLGSITRSLFPNHPGQIGRQNPPGRDVQRVIDSLVSDGALREAGTYKRGTLYEPTQ